MWNWIRNKLSGSITWTVGAAVLALAILFAPVSWGGPLGGGILWKGLTALCGVVVWMAGFRLFFWVRSISVFQPETLRSIRNDPLASAIWLGCVAIALAMITGAAMGQGVRPSPAAWPDARVSPAIAAEPAARAPAEVVWTPEAWPAHFAACEPYRADIEAAVATYWGAFQHADAWAAQIYQESLCRSAAVSPAGAAGLAQFMPATWAEAQAHFGIRASPHDDIAIEAGAWYMMRQMGVWRSPRPARSWAPQLPGLSGWARRSGPISSARRMSARPPMPRIFRPLSRVSAKRLTGWPAWPRWPRPGWKPIAPGARPRRPIF